MRTQYLTASSLDGFIADANESLEWLDRLGNAEDTFYPTFIRDVGAIAMGSSTYLWLLRNHVRPEGKPEQPWPYDLPVWVFSSRELPIIGNANIQFVRGDVRPVHETMKTAAQGKNVWIAGGGDLVGQFYDAGLLDDIFVTIGSVTLGSGKPLLPRAITNPPLRLVSARALNAGMVDLHYEVVRP